MKQYLKTTTNCDLINIEFENHNSRQANLDNDVIIPQNFKFGAFKVALESALKEKWKNKQFRKGCYYWVTLTYKSCFLDNLY